MQESVQRKLSDEPFWYQEHIALFISTFKWAVLGAIVGLSVGYSSHFFLWWLGLFWSFSQRLNIGFLHFYYFLPFGIMLCVWIGRMFAPGEKGDGTEIIIAAIHQNYGKVKWQYTPIKLFGTVMDISLGGSVGKEGPCAQIGASIASLFADILHMSREDRRKLVICGISAGFAAVFGLPISGAIFGIEVLYLGRIEYSVMFPAILAGIISHVTCGYQPFLPIFHGDVLASMHQTDWILYAMLFGVIFGLTSLVLIETMRALEKYLLRYEKHPYGIAFWGGVGLVILYRFAGDQFAGLGVPIIEDTMQGALHIFFFAFLIKIIATAITLESGGTGGIVTPLFFIGSTSGAVWAHLLHLPISTFASFGFVAVMTSATNTPLAGAIMGMEMLPTALGVYAALCTCIAFIIVGHRSVIASQKIGLSKSAGLDVKLGESIGEISHTDIRIRKGSLAEKALSLGAIRVRRANRRKPTAESSEPREKDIEDNNDASS